MYDILRYDSHRVRNISLGELLRTHVVIHNNDLRGTIFGLV